MWTPPDFKPLPEFAKLFGCPNRAKNAATVAKNVTKTHQFGLAVSNPGYTQPGLRNDPDDAAQVLGGLKLNPLLLRPSHLVRPKQSLHLDRKLHSGTRLEPIFSERLRQRF